MERVYNHTDTRQIANLLNQVIGQFENTGSITLANAVATTTVSNPKITAQSRVFLQPRNANAVSANAFISSISNGSFVIGHAAATTERKLDYVFFL